MKKTIPRELLDLLALALGVQNYAPPGSLRHKRRKPDEYVRAMLLDARFYEKHGKCTTLKSIATQVGVSLDTVRRWRRDVDYRMFAFGGEAPLTS